MNKRWLIKIEDNIFYDSENRLYRYRQHCPNCGVLIPKCQCYEDLDQLLGDIDDDIADVCCSSKCCLLSGEWNDIDEAMQEAGFERDINLALTELTDEQRIEAIKEYTLEGVFIALLEKGSEIPIGHLKNPSHSEQLEILRAMGDAKDILWNNDINIYPEIKDLTEDQASEILKILTADADFDYPHGDFCK